MWWREAAIDSLVAFAPGDIVHAILGIEPADDQLVNCTQTKRLRLTICRE